MFIYIHCHAADNKHSSTTRVGAIHMLFDKVLGPRLNIAH